MQVLKIVLREPSNRQVLRKADIATILEHLRLRTAPAVTHESAKALLNCCFDPVNAMRLVALGSLKTLSGILDGSCDDEARIAVTGVIQSICLQESSAMSL